MCEECCGPLRTTRRQAIRSAAVGSIALWSGSRSLLRSSRRSAVPPLGIEVVPGLRILPREMWADAGRQPTRPMGPEDVRFLLVHHTASGNGYGPEDVVGVLRGAYDLHVGPEKGFSDIAYNFLIDRFGTVWEGRQGSIAGPVIADATGGSQGFAQLVCLVGDFTSELPTEEALASLTRTLAWLADRAGIDTTPGATTTFVSRGSNRWPNGAEVVAATISGHRDMSATACPGDTFYPMVHDGLQATVDALRATTTATTLPPPTTVPPTTLPPTTLPPTTVPPTTLPPTTLPPTSASTAAPSSQPAGTTSSPSVPATAAPASGDSPHATGSGASDGSVRSAVGWGAGIVAVAAAGTGLALARRPRASGARDGLTDEALPDEELPSDGPPDNLD